MEILLCATIFICKVIEVSLGTLRIMLITKGQRLLGSIIAFFEISIWVVLASTVLTSLTENPWKALMYICGFAVGNYVGSFIEEKLAIGISVVNITCHEETTDKVLDKLQELGIGYNIIDTYGQKDKNNLIIANIQRKKLKETLSEIDHLDIKVFVTVAESKSVYGGYGLKK